MNDLPDSVLLEIFSYVPLRDQIRLESVSTRWSSVLNDKRLRKIINLDLNLLVKGDISKLPRAVHSLLVSKNKIINSITCVTQIFKYVNIESLNAIMSTFSSIRPEHVTSLKMGHDPRFPHSSLIQQSQADEFSQFLNCFVNLEVLYLALALIHGYGPHTKIDLSRLMKLKELKGDAVQFVNCRAQNLVKMNLCGITLCGTNDCIDFVQMMSSVAENIEVLHLSDVELVICPPSKRQMDLKFSKLSDFNVSDCILYGITVNLAESRSLKRLKFTSNRDCVITNFNLSIHCLEYFNVDLWYSDSDFDYQFIASAKADPQRLCLLEYFKIINCFESIVEVLDCFNPCFTYSLRTFISNDELTDSSGMISLIEHCPLLNHLNGVCIGGGFNTNHEVLIDLIVGTISSDIHVNGLRIEPGDGSYFRIDHAFLSKLYNGLCLIDKKTMKCQNKVFVKVDDCASDLIGKIKDEFNIIFFSTEDQFKLGI